MGANSLLMWVNNSSIRINKLFSWTNSSLIQQRISLSRLALRLTPQGVCSPILKHHVKKKKKWIQPVPFLEWQHPSNVCPWTPSSKTLLRRCQGCILPNCSEPAQPRFASSVRFLVFFGESRVDLPPFLHELLTDTILGDFRPLQRMSKAARWGKRPSIMNWGWTGMGLILLVLSALFVKKICLKAERERDGLLDLFSRQLR